MGGPPIHLRESGPDHGGRLRFEGTPARGTGSPVGFPYVPVFLVLLLIYMVYSEWVRLDSRYLIGAALLLLAVTAVVDALGATGTANLLAEFVFFLLGGGVVLLLVDHVRERRGRGLSVSATDPTEPAKPG